jgi:branched-chain amino acid transport system substrate-binding protein
MIFNRRKFQTAFFAAGFAGLSPALFTPTFAQEQLKLPAILEISGAGAVSGTNFRDGILLALDHINAAGGILGKKIALDVIDTGSDSGRARAAVQRALDANPTVVFGPVFSGSVSASLKLTDEAKVPQIIGGEAANLTSQGSKHIFRTSFGQNVSMPKLANYIRDGLKAKSVAVVYVNNDFGRGGRNAIVKELESRGIKIAADVSTESGQVDFAADLFKLKAANADVIFVYTNEEESARFLIEANKQGVTTPLIGETTLLGQKVLDIAKNAANGVRGHVGLTVDAPSALVKEFSAAFETKYKYKADHNGMKGYLGAYLFKTAAEKVGKFEPAAIATAMRGMRISPDQVKGILIDASWDETGEIDRESYLAEIKDGKQVIIQTLPKLKP